MDDGPHHEQSLEFGVWTRLMHAFRWRSLRISVHGDALGNRLEHELLPPEECSYVLGNPPFVGAKYQSTQQREQVRRLAALGRSGGTLDYVTAWFIKAGEYIQRGETQIGFVATNSITQGRTGGAALAPPV